MNDPQDSAIAARIIQSLNFVREFNHQKFNADYRSVAAVATDDDEDDGKRNQFFSLLCTQL